MRHVANISGKDSLTMALLLKEQEPDLPLEYVFCDTGVEHPSTYAFIEAITELIPLRVIVPPKSYEELLTSWGGYLPSGQHRWCTRELKIVPFQLYVGKADVTSYIGLRADEDSRLGMIPRSNEQVRYPLREYNVGLAEVKRTIERIGMALPERRGCYCCWGQKRWEWLMLAKYYPDLFAESIRFEQMSKVSEFTFIRNRPLPELVKRWDKVMKRAKKLQPELPFPEWEGENDDGDSVCRIWCK